MQQDKPIYTIVCLSPSEIQQKIDSLKIDMGIVVPQVKPLPPNIILKDMAHFAIKRSFTIKDGYTVDDITKTLENIKVPSVEINCQNTNIFSNSNYGAMVFLEIERDSQLFQLHQNIKNAIDNYIDTKNPEHEGPNWLPHITFTYNTPTELIDNYTNQVNTKLLPISFSLDKIHLLKEYDMTKDERSIIKIYE